MILVSDLSTPTILAANIAFQIVVSIEPPFVSDKRQPWVFPPEGA